MRGVWGSLRVVVVTCAMVAGACGDDDGGTGGGDAGVDAGPAGAIARFAPSDGAAMAFGDVPYPHDLYLGTDGTVDLANLPFTGSSTPALDALLEAVNAQTGSWTVCSTHFYIGGQLDAASVPSESASGAGEAIVMIDADPESPERGRAIPVDVQWRPTAGLLTVRPKVGEHLRRSTTYAVALTGLRAGDGTALLPSPAFSEVRDGDGGDAAIARARAIVEPALVELETFGVEPQRVVSLAVFTTEDPSAKTVALRDAIHAAPVPTASVDLVYPNATTSLDQLTGVPATAGFGLDIPEAGGAEGEVGIPHETVGQIVLGRLTASRVISGADGELGVLVRDAAGAPTVTGTLEIPFVLVVPAGADVASLPVVVLTHGLARTMADGLVLADTVGTAGIAVLAFDQFEHGARSSSATDELTVRGAAGSDGFSEHDGMVPVTRLAATRDVPAGMEAAVTYVEGAYGQVAADAFSVARWIAEGDLSAIAAADPALAGLAFDPDAIYWAGNSFGTIAGAIVLAAEPTVDAVLLNVPTGGFAETIAGSARNRTLVTTAFLPIFGIRGTIDEVSRKLLLEPMIDMLEHPIEWLDPRTLAPLVYRDPAVSGPRPDVLVQIAELDDFGPVSGGEGIAAALGAQRIGPFRYASSVEAATLPVSANLETPASAVTAVAHLYEDAPHTMIGYNRYEVLFAEPIEPPFVPLDEPRIVDAPTTEGHLEIRQFFGSRLATGRARLE